MLGRTLQICVSGNAGQSQSPGGSLGKQRFSDFWKRFIAAAIEDAESLLFLQLDYVFSYTGGRYGDVTGDLSGMIQCIFGNCKVSLV